MSQTVTAQSMTKATITTADQLTMPAEFAPHTHCIMSLCAAHNLYTKRQIKRLRLEQVDIANAIVDFEPVTMLVNVDDRRWASEWLDPNVKLVELGHYDIWTRDTLPTVSVGADGRYVAVSWNFNAWGEKFSDYDLDRQLAAKVAQHQNMPLIRAAIVTEGGAFDVDGEGTLLATTSSLLNDNRNPGASKDDIEAEFARLTGARKMIWLNGSLKCKITDGHVDGVARFVRPGVVVVQVIEDPHDPDYTILLENADKLEHDTDAAGRKLEVFRIYRPRREVMGKRGKNFAATYVNFYLPNNGLIIPRFGDPLRDAEAREMLSGLMPEREVVQLQIDEIAECGGGIHCCTQQIP